VVFPPKLCTDRKGVQYRTVLLPVLPVSLRCHLKKLTLIHVKRYDKVANFASGDLETGEIHVVEVLETVVLLSKTETELPLVN
jgi:hypothetical protein